MKVSSHRNTDPFFTSFLNPPLAKGFTDLPAFEDAFDTMSLKKFYQEQESTNSQSNFSPRKSSSITEDFFFDFEQKDFSFSPFPFNNAKKPYLGSLPNIEDEFHNPFGELQQDLGDSFFPRRTRSHFIPRALDMDNAPNFSQPFQISPPQKTNAGAAENKLLNLQPERSHSTFSAAPLFTCNEKPLDVNPKIFEHLPSEERNHLFTTAKENEENKRIERLLKAKKIFKVMKPSSTNSQVVANLKAKAGKSEGAAVGEVVKIKRGLSESSQYSNNLISFNFNIPGIKANGMGANPGNFVKLIPKTPNNVRAAMPVMQENKPQNNHPFLY